MAVDAVLLVTAAYLLVSFARVRPRRPATTALVILAAALILETIAEVAHRLAGPTPAARLFLNLSDLVECAAALTVAVIVARHQVNPQKEPCPDVTDD